MPSPEPMDLEAIRSQVEFYFGLDNLMQDAFLLSRMNARMMVPLSTIFSFKKIRQLTTSFDTVLLAVQQSSSRLVVEYEDNEWWIGPNPQACPESRCTIVLSNVGDDVTVEDIEALTVAPLLHSYNFANGTWYATYQHKYAAKTALLEMQGRLLRGVPVKASLKVSPKNNGADTQLRSATTALNKNAAPYQVPNRPPKNSNSPQGTPSHRSPQWLHQKPSPVAGCPVYISRSPPNGDGNSKRPASPNNNNMPNNGNASPGANAFMSTFYAMSPVQQQMLMMNFLMQQQHMMMGGCGVGNNFVPPFHLHAQQQAPGNRQFTRQRRDENNANEAEEGESRRKGAGHVKSNTNVGATSQNRGVPRMEALGADLPDVEPEHKDVLAPPQSVATEKSETQRNSRVQPAPSADGAGRSQRSVEKEVPQATPLDPTRYPTLGSESSQHADATPLSGWAAVAKAKPVKAVPLTADVTEGTSTKKQKNGNKESKLACEKRLEVIYEATPTSTAAVTESSTPTSSSEETRGSDVSRSYASLLSTKVSRSN